MLGDLIRGAAEVAGSIVGLAVAPLALALDVTEDAVKAAFRAGCKTKDEVKDWIRENWVEDDGWF